MFSKVRLLDSISILNSKCGTVPDKMFDLLRSLLLFLACRLQSLSDGGFSKHVRQNHSTVTDLAKFLGLSTSVPFCNAT